MVTQIYNSRQLISYKYKFSILIAIVFLCLSLLALHGSEVEQKLFRYILPIITGGVIGFFTGSLLDNWHKSLQMYQKSNITLKKKLNQMKACEAWHSAIFEKNHSIIILLNPTTGQIEEANTSACEFYGYPIEQLKQMHISEIDSLPADPMPYKTARAENEQSQKLILKHRLSSGEERDVELFSGSIIINDTSFLFLVVNDVTEQKILRGIIPICAHCKQTRNFEGGWSRIEEYIEHHSEAKFTHGVCPSCVQKHYPTVHEFHKEL